MTDNYRERSGQQQSTVPPWIIYSYAILLYNQYPQMRTQLLLLMRKSKKSEAFGLLKSCQYLQQTAVNLSKFVQSPYCSSFRQYREKLESLRGQIMGLQNIQRLELVTQEIRPSCFLCISFIDPQRNIYSCMSSEHNLKFHAINEGNILMEVWKVKKQISKSLFEYFWSNDGGIVFLGGEEYDEQKIIMKGFKIREDQKKKMRKMIRQMLRNKHKLPKQSIDFIPFFSPKTNQLSKGQYICRINCHKQKIQKLYYTTIKDGQYQQAITEINTSQFPHRNISHKRPKNHVNAQQKEKDLNPEQGS